MLVSTVHCSPFTDHWLSKGRPVPLKNLHSQGEFASLFKSPAELAGCALGGLQRVDFLGFLGRPGFCHVGGHAALPGSPFDGRLGEDETVFTGWKFLDFLAPDALFNDLVAGASIELASVLAHEETLDTLFYVCANHGYHILSERID